MAEGLFYVEVDDAEYGWTSVYRTSSRVFAERQTKSLARRFGDDAVRLVDTEAERCRHDMAYGTCGTCMGHVERGPSMSDLAGEHRTEGGLPASSDAPRSRDGYGRVLV